MAKIIVLLSQTENISKHRLKYLMVLSSVQIRLHLVQNQQKLTK